ncbi:MAG: hypothetical protein GXO68_05715 [Crenarchaeota archaeon]|nr:hypothetical protein [Thermoproteota archaeon]
MSEEPPYLVSIEIEIPKSDVWDHIASDVVWRLLRKKGVHEIKIKALARKVHAEIVVPEIEDAIKLLQQLIDPEKYKITHFQVTQLIDV